MAAARARGRLGGRPSKLSPEQRKAARKLYDEREHTVEQIGKILGVSRTSIYRALAQDQAPVQQPAVSAPPQRRRRQAST